MRAPTAPDMLDRLLAALSLLLGAVILFALLRGAAHWTEVPGPIWAHLATILPALLLTPVMLLRRRGDRWHRRLGWVWAVAMFATALISFTVRTINPGHLSAIHILSAITLVSVPQMVIAARRHDVKTHRLTVRMMVSGALLIAGFFTLSGGRLLGHWLLG